MKSDGESFNCPRCGLKVSSSEQYCPACGYMLQNEKTSAGSDSSKNNKTKTTNTLPDFNFDKPKKKNIIDDSQYQDLFSKLYGWEKVSGSVIAVDQPYQIEKVSTPFKSILKFVFGIIIFPIIICTVLAIAFTRKIHSFLDNRPTRSGSGFGSRIMSHFFGYFLIGKLTGPKETISVKDIRLRDKKGREYLLRVIGDLVMGNFSVGDEIIVEGKNEGGAIIVKKGWNCRTKSEIKVRRK